MNVTIREHVAGTRLRDAVPPAYRDEIMKDAKPDGVYTLPLCPHEERDVVHSTPLAPALKRISAQAPDGIVIVGTVFTEEALTLAAGHGARVVAAQGQVDG